MAELRVTSPALPKVQQASTAVQLSEAAMMAPGKGLEAMGKSIGQVGQYFGEFAKQAQGAKDLAAEKKYAQIRTKTFGQATADADVMVAEGHLKSDYKEQFVRNRMSEWDKKDGNTLLEGVSKDTRTQILGNAGLQMERDMVSYKMSNARQEVAKITDELSTSAKLDAELGTQEGLDSAKETYREMQRRGLIYDAESEIEKATGISQRANLDQRVSSDPVNMSKYLNEQRSLRKEDRHESLSHLSDDQIDGAIRKADGISSKNESELYGGFGKRLDMASNPEKYGIPPEQAEDIDAVRDELIQANKDGMIDDNSLISLMNVYTNRTKSAKDSAYQNAFTSEILIKGSSLNTEFQRQNYYNEAHRRVLADLQEGKIGAGDAKEVIEELNDFINKEGSYRNSVESGKKSELLKLLKDSRLSGKKIYYTEIAKSVGIDEDDPEYGDFIHSQYRKDVDALEAALNIPENANKSVTDIWNEYSGISNMAVENEAVANLYGSNKPTVEVRESEIRETGTSEKLKTLKDMIPDSPLAKLEVTATKGQAMDLLISEYGSQDNIPKNVWGQFVEIFGSPVGVAPEVKKYKYTKKRSRKGEKPEVPEPDEIEITNARGVRRSPSRNKR